MPIEAISHSEAETRKLAAGIAGLLKPGDVIFLTGQLGAGKTFFIREAARALGVAEPVTSPSFTMGQSYRGRITVHHLDLYRLAEFDAEDAIDFEPFFEADAITFVEWPEVAAAFFIEPVLTVALGHLAPESRRITMDSPDDALMERLGELIAGTGS